MTKKHALSHGLKAHHNNCFHGRWLKHTDCYEKKNRHSPIAVPICAFFGSFPSSSPNHACISPSLVCFSPVSLSVLLHISLHYVLLLFLICTVKNRRTQDNKNQKVCQPSCQPLFQAVSLPIWHSVSLPHGNRKARIGQMKPREKKGESVRECVRLPSD